MQKRVRMQNGEMLQGGKRLFNRVLDLVYPRRCAVCDEITDYPGRGVCSSCENKIIYIKAPFCMKCGRQLNRQEGELCEACMRKKHLFVQGTALYDYGSMSDSIFRFKYEGRQEYALFYGKQLYEKRGKWLAYIKPDALIPVPVHPSRKRSRGYNQSELIARALSELSGIPVNTKLVVRTKKTLPQKNLSERERQNNLKRAFKIRQNDVKLNTIVIIDDIFTTGSTINEMAGVLKKVGIREIYFMTLAVGRGM